MPLIVKEMGFSATEKQYIENFHGVQLTRIRVND